MPIVWEPTLDEDGRRWRQLARELAADRFAPLAEELDREGRYPWENVAALVESGLAGLFIPRDYGGQGASFATTCAVIEAVSRGCASTGAILTAYSLGGTPLLLVGTPEQQGRYLGEMARGNAVSFALTEVGAGSDAAAITASGRRDGDGWHLTGEKIFIGNGGASRYYVVFVRTDPEAGSRGITAYMVDRDADGVTIDRYEDKMGLRGTLTSNLRLDVTVPDEARLGDVGGGLKLALRTLDAGRIGVAAQAVGIGLAALDIASVQATRRHTFGRPIIDNQGISFRLADVATELSAARMLTFDAAAAYDEGRDVGVPGAMAKLYASEAAHHAVDAAVQVFGGAGYCRPCPAERLYRDQRIVEIYEGTSEIQRLVLGRAIKRAVESATKE
ncbi:MAG: acyl-CoA dehydrogenase [Streptosporangiales bacterium]|nr:acyl-CoA dehydrogenase [Streptosporangiales bacterium]